MQPTRLSWMSLLIGTTCLFLPGCDSGGNPFEVAPVSGKITYEDGTPIDAGMVTVFFVPQDVEADGDKHPHPASVLLESDGSFANLSMSTQDDGAIVGRHKVVLECANSDFTPCPQAVDARYLEASTSPLEVEVTTEGPNQFNLTVERGS